MNGLNVWTVVADIISSTIVFAVPLLLVAMGGMFSERSGIINIALEGIMIIGALMGCLMMRWLDPLVVNGQLGSQLAMLIATLFAGVCGIAFSVLLAFASINLKADQTIGGTALNMLAPALAIVLTWVVQGQGQTTILIPTWSRITEANFGLTLEKGSFIQALFFKNFYLTTILTIILFAAAVILMYKTRFGLRLRSCGEHPQAAASVGINVFKMRYAGVLISGFLGGIGGLAFTLAAGSGFQSSVAGYGFLALAVMIFGNWKPWSILGASLFFALFKVVGAYATTLQKLGTVFNALFGWPDKIGIKEGISSYLWPMLPYIITMILLVLTSKKSRAPKAEGIPYDKGMR
ncbi:MAG: ABC transporter permease [Clostridia bacterium]|nr:ABC transporter permease [Clostridia bacterium]